MKRALVALAVLALLAASGTIAFSQDQSPPKSIVKAGKKVTPTPTPTPNPSPDSTDVVSEPRR